jgi:hypothetical protein
MQAVHTCMQLCFIRSRATIDLVQQLACSRSGRTELVEDTVNCKVGQQVFYFV